MDSGVTIGDVLEVRVRPRRVFIVPAVAGGEPIRYLYWKHTTVGEVWQHGSCMRISFLSWRFCSSLPHYLYLFMSLPLQSYVSCAFCTCVHVQALKDILRRHHFTGVDPQLDSYGLFLTADNWSVSKRKGSGFIGKGRRGGGKSVVISSSAASPHKNISAISGSMPSSSPASSGVGTSGSVNNSKVEMKIACGFASFSY